MGSTNRPADADMIQELRRLARSESFDEQPIGRVRRKERWNLPPLAVREALINAVAHADYSQRGAPIRVSLVDDRLEIENPWLLPSGLTIEDLERGVSKLRKSLEVRGVDLLEFADGKITRKDSFWKFVE